MPNLIRHLTRLIDNAIPCQARNDKLCSENLLLSLDKYLMQSSDRNFNYLMLVELF